MRRDDPLGGISNGVVTGIGALLLLGLLAGGTSGMVATTNDDATTTVRDAETAFARTMAARDLEAFARFVSEGAVFIGEQGVRRGRDEVVAAWSGFFAGPEAPFAWESASVEVLPSGDLAYSTGPVFTPDGDLLGRFHSVWRLENDGVWRVVLDRGGPVCDEP